MPCKLVKKGLKIWLRCNSRCGFLQQFSIYVRKVNTQPLRNGAIFEIVNDLMKKIQFKYQVSTDKRYIFQVNIVNTLFKRKYFLFWIVMQYYLPGIYSCGTVKGNKMFLPNLIKKPPSKMIRGQHYMFKDQRLSNLTSCVWCDVKVVSIYFSIHLKLEGTHT